MGNSLNWLVEQVEKIYLDESLFHITYDEEKYIYGAIHKVEENEVDIFSISSIYNVIIDLNAKIKYSFEMAARQRPSENLNDYKVFAKPSLDEMKTIYYIENMIFRISTLWDMLAQICNVFWKKNIPIDAIYTSTFFHDYSQGKKKMHFAEIVYDYFKEDDEIKGDIEKWKGNFEYLKEYRNQMSHRNSPNVSITSNFGLQLRPPAIFVLKRATEDYLKAIEFITMIIDEILKDLEKGSHN